MIENLQSMSEIVPLPRIVNPLMAHGESRECAFTYGQKRSKGALQPKSSGSVPFDRVKWREEIDSTEPSFGGENQGGQGRETQNHGLISAVDGDGLRMHTIGDRVAAPTKLPRIGRKQQLISSRARGTNAIVFSGHRRQIEDHDDVAMGSDDATLVGENRIVVIRTINPRKTARIGIALPELGA